MVTFKGWCDKLYYTQHTLLNNVGQLPILFFFFFFLRNKHAHTQGKGFKHKGTPELHSKAMVTVHLQSSCVYLHIFTSINVGG